MRADVPAVVVGAGINGLGVVRSLARARVPAFVLDSDAQQPAMYSRAATPIRVQSMHGEALVDELVRLGRTDFAKTRPVLLLTQEESVTWVSRRRERLASSYRFALPAVKVVDALLSKHGFQRVAEDYGAPIPGLVRVTAEADLQALDRLRYPVVVKPAERNANYSRSFRKAYRIESARDAVDLVRRMLPVMPDIVVQEWTEGPDSNIHFCLQYIDSHGKVAASFTGRKIRSWPPGVGGTASCTAAPHAHVELSALTERFFRQAGVIGMAGMEYKRDEHSGRFLMVEPTIGRTDYQEEVATLNGVNLPYVAWCTETGATPRSPARMPRSRVWRVRSEDVQSAAAQGQATRQGLAGAGRVIDATWRWSDPKPALAQNLRHLRRALRLRASKVRRRPRVAGEKP